MTGVQTCALPISCCTDRVPHQSRHIAGLWFAGDQYDERTWGCGVDAAVLPGIVCVDQMMGTNLEEQILPAVHQGIMIQT